MVIVGSRGAEHQVMRVFPPPDFDTALQRSQQFIRVGIRLLTLEPLEQFSRSSPWFGVKPLTQLRRHRQERVRASAPIFADFLLHLTAAAADYLSNKSPGDLLRCDIETTN
jgi:hypothetical protein